MIAHAPYISYRNHEAVEPLNGPLFFQKVQRLSALGVDVPDTTSVRSSGIWRESVSQERHERPVGFL